MPLAVLEALAYAKPLLLSNISAMDSFICNNGLLVENEIDAVVAALTQLQNEDLKMMGQHSKNIFDKQYNLIYKKQEYLDFYEKLFI